MQVRCSYPCPTKHVPLTPGRFHSEGHLFPKGAGHHGEPKSWVQGSIPSPSMLCNPGQQFRNLSLWKVGFDLKPLPQAALPQRAPFPPQHTKSHMSKSFLRLNSKCHLLCDAVPALQPSA